jgi:hypothetical protein
MGPVTVRRFIEVIDTPITEVSAATPMRRLSVSAGISVEKAG